jgi:thioredoxin 1
MASENLITLTEANFSETINGAKVPVLVDFWAEWCGPCRMLTPILEQLAADKGASIIIGKVNVDECPNLAAQFGVSSIPMLAFIKDGKVAESVVGVQSKDAIAKKLEALA